jgi:hypothetical protein
LGGPDGPRGAELGLGAAATIASESSQKLASLEMTGAVSCARSSSKSSMLPEQKIAPPTRRSRNSRSHSSMPSPSGNVMSKIPTSW